MDTLGVIGHGVVGQAVEHGFAPYFDVCVYDKHKTPQLGSSGHVCESIYELVHKVNGPIFVCVPTPMGLGGECDTSIVEDVVEEINKAAQFTDDIPVVAIKSTVVPGTTKKLSEKYFNIVIGFNPEFLTERTAIDDFKNQDRVVVGASGSALWAICTCFSKAFPKVPIYCCSTTEAEMVKYTANVHLATKVALANEIYQICNKLNISYDKVIELATKDQRLGKSHWDVPGPDGMMGFGGTCFPKDINALVFKACELGIRTHVMEGAWATNLDVRLEREE